MLSNNNNSSREEDILYLLERIDILEKENKTLKECINDEDDSIKIIELKKEYSILLSKNETKIKGLINSRDTYKNKCNELNEQLEQLPMLQNKIKDQEFLIDGLQAKCANLFDKMTKIDEESIDTIKEKNSIINELKIQIENLNLEYSKEYSDAYNKYLESKKNLTQKEQECIAFEAKIKKKDSKLDILINNDKKSKDTIDKLNKKLIHTDKNYKQLSSRCIALEDQLNNKKVIVQKLEQQLISSKNNQEACIKPALIDIEAIKNIYTKTITEDDIENSYKFQLLQKEYKDIKEEYSNLSTLFLTLTNQLEEYKKETVKINDLKKQLLDNRQTINSLLSQNGTYKDTLSIILDKKYKK